jgi:RNA polymerase sigma-70 factor (ECF subfamily)
MLWSGQSLMAPPVAGGRVRRQYWNKFGEDLFGYYCLKRSGVRITLAVKSVGGGTIVRAPFARDGIFMQSDQELIDSANRGDAEAFEALYCRYRDWVYRLAWRFTGSRDQSLDVLQETEDDAFAALPAPEATDGRDSHSELAAVLSVLAAEQREVLLMRFVDEMTLEEIAEALKTRARGNTFWIDPPEYTSFEKSQKDETFRRACGLNTYGAQLWRRKTNILTKTLTSKRAQSCQAG